MTVRDFAWYNAIGLGRIRSEGLPLSSQHRGVEQLVARRAHNPGGRRFESCLRYSEKGQWIPLALALQVGVRVVERAPSTAGRD